MSLIQTVPIRLLLVPMLLYMNMCNCSAMKIGHVIVFDLFEFNYSSLSPYFTKLTIGSPPKTFRMLIDTSSDLTWVDCTDTRRNFYNISESSTAVSCPEGKRKCKFNIDASQSSGFVVSDFFHFYTQLPDSSRSPFSTEIVFGCSTRRKYSKLNIFDGILGLGRDSSLISQLFSKQIAPKVVSHCLTNGGGGYLLLGEVVERGITYSPLIPSKSTYNAALESIFVDGRQISSPTFASRNGTIFDFGTTMTFFENEVYVSLVTAVDGAVNVSVLPGFSQICYDAPSRDIFPNITLKFVGGASMLLTPRDYMLDSGVWCIGFQKDEKMTILGDLILRDKVIIYDQPHERIGWLDRNCSLSINMSLEYNFTSNSRSWRVAGASWGHVAWWAVATIVVIVFFEYLIT